MLGGLDLETDRGPVDQSQWKHDRERQPDLERCVGLPTERRCTWKLRSGAQPDLEGRVGPNRRGSRGCCGEFRDRGPAT